MLDRYGPGGGGGPGGHGPRGFDGFRVGHGYEVWHWVFFAAVLAAAVLLVIFLVQRSRNGHAVAVAAPMARPSNDAALTETRMRYARGAITREEFLRVWNDLGGAPLPMDSPVSPAPEEPPPAPDGGSE